MLMKTYCVMDIEKNRNRAVVLDYNNDSDFLKWKKELYDDLIRSTYPDFDDEVDVQRLYCDPDNTYQKGYNHEFFDKLVLFLNERERDCQDKLKGRFRYEFCEEGCGIKVMEIGENGSETELFYLRSDQFGFSAPSNEKNHPYDLYISKCSDKQKAVNQVIQWIAATRTIGGSFLWPYSFWRQYNPRRGGRIHSSRRYNIQDRVDLTLWEIKYRYEDRAKETIMKSVAEGVKDFHLDLWLDHFADFKTYIEFFRLQPFVNDAGEPYDILNSTAENKVTSEPQWKSDGSNPEPQIRECLSAEKIEEMLTFVSEGIIRRSEDIINAQSKM